MMATCWHVTNNTISYERTNSHRPTTFDDGRELVWRFTDLFDQLWSIREILEQVKNVLKNNESIIECNLPNTIDDYQ